MTFPRFDSAKILTVGDAMIDRYWHGDAKRISAEAPIPVVEVKEIEDRVRTKISLRDSVEIIARS